MDASCIFCRIAAGQIPVDLLYQDEEVVAFRDIKPQAPTHVLIIPREHIPTVNDLGPAHDELAGRLVMTAKKIAKNLGVDKSGYRIVLNCNKDAGQEVFHVHAHLLGGRKFAWPPG
jgi:histidine triad (HIT) family protein